jgi:threonine synthase
VKERIQKLFEGYCCDDAETQKVIHRIYEKYDYVIDPHTAVAFSALEQYRKKTDDQTPCLVVSTASPYKFCDHVLQALGEKEIAQGMGAFEQLHKRSGRPIPPPLAELGKKPIRFTQVVEKEEMVDAVLSMLV